MKLVGLIVTIFVTWPALAYSQDGRPGAQGEMGANGKSGSNGSISIIGFRCVISTNIEHLKMCLEDGVSVNEKLPSGRTILQSAIFSRDLPMLETILKNPDPKNQPDLRVRFMNVANYPGGLNTYELILYGRVLERQNGDSIQVNDDLREKLYLDNTQVAQLKLILTLEPNKESLIEETQQALAYLRASKFNSASSVQEAITLINEAIAK